MLRYMVGFSIPFVSLAALALADQWDYASYRAENLLVLLARAVGVPLGAAWLAWETAVWLRRPRLFDLRASRPWARVFAGALGGAIAAGLVVLSYAVLRRSVPDTALLGGASALATLMIVLPLPRGPRPGRCIRCGYDLVGLREPVCPECGTLNASDSGLVTAHFARG